MGTGRDDSYAPNYALFSQGRNLIISTISADLTTVTLVNPMDGFGSITQAIGTFAYGHKGQGLTSVGGCLYLSVGLHDTTGVTGNPATNLRQTIRNGSIYKSCDGGATWLNYLNNVDGSVRNWLTSNNASSTAGVPRSDGAALRDSTTGQFTDVKFVAPMFVQYGKDGSEPVVEGNDTYVYATSTNGYYQSGDFYTLGRVLKNAIQGTTSWQYYKGGIGGSVTNDANWDVIGNSTPIYTNTRKVTMNGAYWHAPSHRYFICNWNYPGLSTATNFGFANNTQWEILTATTLSGPWTIIKTQAYPTLGYYSPTPSLRHSSGAVLKLLFSGDFTNNLNNPQVTNYSLNSLDMTVTNSVAVSVSGATSSSGKSSTQ